MCPYNYNKFDFKFALCLFLGHNTHYKDYLCLSQNGKVYISKHVVFDENVFSFHKHAHLLMPIESIIVTYRAALTLNVLSPFSGPRSAHPDINKSFLHGDL